MTTHREMTRKSRQAIYEAAVECLCESGFDRATTVAICKRAQVSRGSFHHHYPGGRIDLFSELVRRYTAETANLGAGNSEEGHLQRMLERVSEDERYYHLLLAVHQIWQAHGLGNDDAQALTGELQSMQNSFFNSDRSSLPGSDQLQFHGRFVMLQMLLAGYVTIRQVAGNEPVVQEAMRQLSQLLIASTPDIR